MILNSELMEFTDCFLAVCNCDTPFSMHWTVDPYSGRLFCMRCKVHPTIKAVPKGQLGKHKDELNKGYFKHIEPQRYNMEILELRERYDNLDPSTDFTTVGTLNDLFDNKDDAEGDKPNQEGSSVD